MNMNEYMIEQTLMLLKDFRERLVFFEFICLGNSFFVIE